MPTNRGHLHPTKYQKRPWHAIVRFQNKQYSLGYHATRGEAQQVEDDFRKANGIIPRYKTHLLTARILEMRDRGLTDTEIGAVLGKSPVTIISTVQRHNRNEKNAN